MSLNAVVSTGRGGAGNMVGNRVEADKADEVIMTEEEFKRYNSSHHLNRHQHQHQHHHYDHHHDKGDGHDHSGSNSHGTVGHKPNKVYEPTIDEDKTYHHDATGKIYASSGRGGAGNITKFEKPPSALVQDGERQEIGLSPVFSTGRGGAGNIHKADRATKTKVTLESELSEQLSPIHSTPSRKSRGSRGGCENGEERVGFLGKLKKFFK